MTNEIAPTKHITADDPLTEQEQRREAEFAATVRHIKPSELKTDLNLTMETITVIDTPNLIERAKTFSGAIAWQIMKPVGPRDWRIIHTEPSYHRAVRICRRLNRDPHKPFHYGIDPVYSLPTILSKLTSCVEQALADLWDTGLIETEAEEFEDWIATISEELKVELDHGVCVVTLMGWMVFLHTTAPDRVEAYWRWSPADLAAPSVA